MKKILKGRVVSDKMEKTVAVEVERIFVHPLYEKRLRKKKKFLAANLIEAKLGDVVEIGETRPKSAQKRWEILRVLKNVTT